MTPTINFKLVARDDGDLEIHRNGEPIRHLVNKGDGRFAGQLANVWGTGAPGEGFSLGYIKKSITLANREAAGVIALALQDECRFKIWRQTTSPDIGFAVGWRPDGAGAKILPVSGGDVEAAREIFGSEGFGMSFFGDIRMHLLKMPTVVLERGDDFGVQVFSRLGLDYGFREPEALPAREDPDMTW